MHCFNATSLNSNFPQPLELRYESVWFWYDFDKALTHLYFPALRTTAGSTVQSYKDWFPMTSDVRCRYRCTSTMYPFPRWKEDKQDSTNRNLAWRMPVTIYMYNIQTRFDKGVIAGPNILRAFRQQHKKECIQTSSGWLIFGLDG